MSYSIAALLDGTFEVRAAGFVGTYRTRAEAEMAVRNARWNEGARIADDCFCQSCGARGFAGDCPSCTRPERGIK